MRNGGPPNSPAAAAHSEESADQREPPPGKTPGARRPAPGPELRMRLPNASPDISTGPHPNPRRLRPAPFKIHHQLRSAGESVGVRLLQRQAAGALPHGRGALCHILDSDTRVPGEPGTDVRPPSRKSVVRRSSHTSTRLHRSPLHQARHNNSIHGLPLQLDYERSPIGPPRPKATDSAQYL